MENKCSEKMHYFYSGAKNGDTCKCGQHKFKTVNVFGVDVWQKYYTERRINERRKSFQLIQGGLATPLQKPIKTDK